MNQQIGCPPSYTPQEITDEEYTLILMMRTMRLDEMMCVMDLNKILPAKLPNKHHHIMNMINFQFQKSYEVHTIRTVIEFISSEPIYDQMFQHHSVEEMITNYQRNAMAQSDGVYELYLMPYTSRCIQCGRQLEPVFTHRPKTIMSLTRNYKARK